MLLEWTKSQYNFPTPYLLDSSPYVPLPSFLFMNVWFLFFVFCFLVFTYYCRDPSIGVDFEEVRVLDAIGDVAKFLESDLVGYPQFLQKYCYRSFWPSAATVRFHQVLFYFFETSAAALLFPGNISLPGKKELRVRHKTNPSYGNFLFRFQWCWNQMGLLSMQNK